MRSFRHALASVLMVASCAAALAQTSTKIDIAGAVQRPLQLDAAALAAQPAADIVSTDRMRGVRLAALVEQAGLVLRDHNDWKKLVVIATATDGYRALFSWPELKNTPVGDGALVIFERDGQPLGEREGRIALVSTLDKQAGPRHVRNLARIEIRSID